MSDSKPFIKVVSAEGAAPSPSPDDAKDVESLWLDPSLGDGLCTTDWQSIPVGRPKGFFRVHPDLAFRRRGEIYVHKIEGQIETTYYTVAPAMKGQILEARPCCVVTCIDREGSPRLWPIMFPKDGEKDNSAWSTARSAARAAIDRWLRLVWNKRAYLTRDALPGYAPDPDWSRVPSFDDLVELGFGQHGIIRDTDHAIYRELMGSPKVNDDDEGI